jgi:DNA-binding MarR family transcriptional regulator
MPLLMLKDLPRYECLIEAARDFPDLDPSASEVFLHLLRTGDELGGVREAHLRSNQTSPGRFTVLMLMLRKDGGCGQVKTPAGLAGMAGVTRATMTGLIDTLERDGLVKRKPHGEDRRMMTVSLTARGEKTIRALLPAYFRLVAGVMAGLSEAERKTLVRLLGKIQDSIAALPPDKTKPRRRAPAAKR